MSETYNGWKNYATWAVHLWLTNEERTERELTPKAERAWAEAIGHEAYMTRSQCARYDLAARLRDWAEGDYRIARIPAGKEASLVADLLGYALALVEWDELADNYLVAAAIGGYEPEAAHRAREAAEAAAANRRALGMPDSVGINGEPYTAR